MRSASRPRPRRALQNQSMQLLISSRGERKPECIQATSAWDKFLHAHPVVHIADVHRAVFADGQVVAPVNLPVIISKPAPLRQDLALQIEFQKAAAVGWRGLQVAAV